MNLTRAISAILALASPMMSCALFVEFEPDAEGGNSATGAAGGAGQGGTITTVTASSGGVGTGGMGGDGGSTGVGGSTGCNAPPIGILLNGGDVSVEGLAVEGTKAWLAVIYEAQDGLSARTVPDDATCAPTVLAPPGTVGRSSAVVQIDLPTYSVDWWMPVSSSVTLDSTFADIDVAVVSGRLVIGATYDVGTALGQPVTTSGMAFTSFDLTDVKPPSTQGSPVDPPKTPAICDGAAATLAIAARAEGFAVAMPVDDKGTANAALECLKCPWVDTDGPDLMVFNVTHAGDCTSASIVKRDTQTATRPSIALSGLQVAVGYVQTSAEDAFVGNFTYTSLNLPPLTSKTTALPLYQPGMTVTDVPVAVTSTHVMSFASTVDANGNRHLNTRDSPNGANFTMDDLDTEGDVIVYGAAAANSTGAIFWIGGAVDEADSLSTALAINPALSLDATGDSCPTTDPAVACPDAFWTSFDGTANKGVNDGERWTHPGRQSIRRVQPSPAGIVVAGAYDGGLSIGTVEVDPNGTGIFLAVRVP